MARNGPQAIVCHLVANGGKADMAGEAGLVAIGTNRTGPAV